jgi:hypothetical protein
MLWCVSIWAAKLARTFWKKIRPELEDLSQSQSPKVLPEKHIRKIFNSKMIEEKSVRKGHRLFEVP